MPRRRPLRATSPSVIRVPITGAIDVRGTTPVPALRACGATMPTIARGAVSLYASEGCHAGERRGLGRSHRTGPASVVQIDGGGRLRRGATRSAMFSHGDGGTPTRDNSGGGANGELDDDRHRRELRADRRETAATRGGGACREPGKLFREPLGDQRGHAEAARECGGARRIEQPPRRSATRTPQQVSSPRCREILGCKLLAHALARRPILARAEPAHELAARTRKQALDAPDADAERERDLLL